jgi:mannosyltransferase OCH1-like enzyme
MIPKIIHYFWFGGNPIPTTDQLCIDSWKRTMPEYEIKRWDESNYDITSVPYMNEAYEAKKWGFVSDYARLDILYRYGGLYFDTDVEILRPFDDILSQNAFIGFEKDHQKYQVNTGSGCGAEPENPIIKAMRDDYLGRHFIIERNQYNTIPTPIYQTEVLIAHGLKLNNTLQYLDGITIYPCEFFSPMDMTTGEVNKTNNTHSIHHYSASWHSVADQERRILRQKYSPKYGLFVAEVLSSLVAYKKHYGAIRMWWQIASRLINKR